MSCTAKVFTVKRGDTAARFQDHLELNGESLDLANGTVKFVMRSKNGAMLVNSFASVIQTGDDQDKSLPNVEYLPSVGDLETLGVHDVEWQCETATGRKVTLPRGRRVGTEIQDQYIQVQVVDTLTPVETSSSSSSETT